MSVKISEERPWGTYMVIDERDQYKVKRITVKKGHKLSLQYHNHRSEHWTVVEGTATVTIGDKTCELNENETIYIPKNEKHSLANYDQSNMVLIEVQYGEYLGEDDIVRLDDIYGRA